MDRQIVYAGQVPYERDILNTNRYALIGVSKLMEALVGPISTSQVAGFGATRNNLEVTLATGQIYKMATVDDVQYSSLAIDSHPLIKQGIKWENTVITVQPAPSQDGSGNDQERVDVISVTFNEADSDSATLQYFNSANPSAPLQGDAGSGLAQNTRRSGQATVALHTGTPAAVGSATAAAGPAGSVEIYQIRIRTGETTLAVSTDPGNPGLYKKETSWVSVGSGTGGQLTSGMQQTGNGIWAQLGAASTEVNNAFYGTQTIQSGSVEPLVVKGGTNLDGVAIKLMDTDSNELQGNKYIRSKGGSLIIGSHSNVDLLTIEDGGDVTVTGSVSLASTQSGANANELITKGFADGIYTTSTGTLGTSDVYPQTGGGGFLLDLSYGGPTVIDGELQRDQSQATWANIDGLAFVTKEAVDGHFNDEVGISEETAKEICLPLTLTAPVTIGDSGDTTNVVNFASGPTTGAQVAEITAAGADVLVPKGFADAAYLRNDQNADGTLDFLTLGSHPAHTDVNKAASVGYVASSYARLDGTDSTFTGTHNFQGATITIADGTSATSQPATMAQVENLISSSAPGANLLGESNNWTGANTFTSAGSVTFQKVPTLSVDPDSQNGGNGLMRRSYADSRYLQLTKGAQASTATIATPVRFFDAENNPREAAASGEPVIFEQLAKLLNLELANQNMEELLTFQKNADISHGSQNEHRLTFKQGAAAVEWDAGDTQLNLKVGSANLLALTASEVRSDKPVVIGNTLTTIPYGTAAHIVSGGYLMAKDGPTSIGPDGEKIAARPKDWTITGRDSTTGSVRHPIGGAGGDLSGGLRQYWTKVTTTDAHGSYWKKKTVNKPTSWSRVVNAQATIAAIPDTSSTGGESVTVAVSNGNVTVYTEGARAVYVLLTGW